MGTIIDMHLHTTRGASDSGLSPEDLAIEARKRGLTGIHVTEHDRLWDRHALQEYRAQHADLLVANGIEVLNGANTIRENIFALQVARMLGMPGTGGSDAHSTQGVGVYCVVFEHRLASQEEALAELHAGRFYAAHGLLSGGIQRFTETSLDGPPDAQV